jgi:uncharacterized protein
MISVADLLKENRIPANYFNYETYVKGDLGLGLLESRRGDRLISIPDTLIAALYTGLANETGHAARLVLFNCGKWWGKNFYTRFSESIAEYYDQSLAEMEMLTFLQCLKECWKTHGWGKFEFDAEHQAQGLLVITTSNSPFSRQVPGDSRPSCFLEAGILTSLFSRLSGRELLAAQTTCESRGEDCNRFVIGLPDRVTMIEKYVLEGLSHAAILAKLL